MSSAKQVEELKQASAKHVTLEAAPDSGYSSLRYDCQKCRKSFSSDGHLERHVRLHEDHAAGKDDSPLLAYKCSVCNARFRHYDALEDHEAETGHRKPYTCHVCDKSFNLQARRNVHMAKVHQLDVSKSEAISTVKRGSARAPCTVQKPEKDREKRHKCPLCDMRFTFKCRLKPHMKQHTGENTFQCPQCPKRFAWQSKLDRHLHFHNDDRPFECSLCGHRTNHTFHLTYHLQSVHELSKEAADAAAKEPRNVTETKPNESKGEKENTSDSVALKREEDNVCDSDVSADEGAVTQDVELNMFEEELAEQPWVE